jgi:hypothetical protein
LVEKVIEPRKKLQPFGAPAQSAMFDVEGNTRLAGSVSERSAGPPLAYVYAQEETKKWRMK